jgi:6-phosphogluconolactonase (cycloisomerase 2 family)
MKHLIRKLSIVAAGGLAAVIPAAAASATPAHPSGDGAIFVQTDSPAGNQILAYDRASDGALTLHGTSPTGGKGAVAVGAAVDPLASQDSLVTADNGRLLLAVNAGSDSVSVFDVHGDHLVLAQVVSSGGTFPVSIAVHGSLVYVLNGGGAGQVAGYFLFGDHLIPLPWATRSLGLANANPPFFLMSPAQVGFTPDGSKLIVTTKASGSSIDVFRVGFLGSLGAPIVNASATPVPFAFTFDPQGRLVVAEAGQSEVSSYTVAPDGKLAVIGSVPDGQAALCWVSPARGHFYVSNAGSATLSSYTLDASGHPVLVGVAAATEAGTTDSVPTANGRFLYVENGGAGTVDGFRVHADGSLTRVASVTGLPTLFEGIAAVD